MSKKENNQKSMLAIVGVITIALVSMTKGLNGDIVKYALGVLLVLGIGEKALEWWYGRSVKPPTKPTD